MTNPPTHYSVPGAARWKGVVMTATLAPAERASDTFADSGLGEFRQSATSRATAAQAVAAEHDAPCLGRFAEDGRASSCDAAASSR